MTATITETSIETVTVTDDQLVEPCVLREDCSDPADWWLVNNCCGSKWGCCSRHRQLYDANEKRMIVMAELLGGPGARPTWFRCPVCHAQFIPGESSHWEAIER